MTRGTTIVTASENRTGILNVFQNCINSINFFFTEVKWRESKAFTDSVKKMNSNMRPSLSQNSPAFLVLFCFLVSFFGNETKEVRKLNKYPLKVNIGLICATDSLVSGLLFLPEETLGEEHLR